jgi:hypothetical protein
MDEERRHTEIPENVSGKLTLNAKTFLPKNKKLLQDAAMQGESAPTEYFGEHEVGQFSISRADLMCKQKSIIPPRV